MAKYPGAVWAPFPGIGRYTEGPFKIVHHTTEGVSASGAIATYRKTGSYPHFTVDKDKVYQHVDTDHAVTALAHPGPPETNRSHALQIELVGFAGRTKDRDALAKMAALCRWLEETHGVPRVWPSGLPKPPRNGQDPGGHNRNARNWETRGGHYGHSHVPGNTHWDPGYTVEEANLVVPPAVPAREVAESGTHLVEERAELRPMGAGMLSGLLENTAYTSLLGADAEEAQYEETEQSDTSDPDETAKDQLARVIQALSADGPKLPDGRPYFFPNGINRIQVKVGLSSSATPEMCIDVDGPPDKAARTGKAG